MSEREKDRERWEEDARSRGNRGVWRREEEREGRYGGVFGRERAAVVALSSLAEEGEDEIGQGAVQSAVKCLS